LSSSFGWVDPSPKAPQKMHLDIPKLLVQPKQKSHCLTRGVSHTMALPFTLKSILRQKKNYGNSNISPCKNIMFKKSSKKTNILQVLGN